MIFGVLIMLANPTLDVVDHTQLTVLMQSMATLADARAFEALEQRFAPEVMVDYTSAFGGEPELKSPQSLMTAWAGLLPGFDVTHHQLSNFRVTQTATTSRGEADVVADHYLGDQHWRISGSYTFQFVHTDHGWLISHLTFHAKDEHGSRDILAKAAQRAQAAPVGYLLRQQTEAAVRQFLTSLETKDMQQFADVWAEDAVQEMPFAPANFPARVVGKPALLKHYGAWPEVSGPADFTKHLIFHPMEDPRMTFAEFKGETTIKTTGRDYRQTYGGLFHVSIGKITLFREYFNPTPFVYAFGLDAE